LWYSAKRRRTISIAFLQAAGSSSVDVGEHASLCRLRHECRIGGVKQGDHGTGRLVDDLVDEIQRVLGAHSEPDQCDVRPFACRRGPDLGDIHLSRDHLMTEGHEDRGDVGQAIGPFVRDQDAHMLGSL